MGGYHLAQVDVTDFPEVVTVPANCDGIGVVFRAGPQPLGFVMRAVAPGTHLDTRELAALAGSEVAERWLALQLRDELEARFSEGKGPPLPTLTVAICTKDRAPRLARLLTALMPIRDASPFAATEILVVDNASVDDATRVAVAGFPGVSYRFEPKAGLDFARNVAVEAATGDLLAFLDDDVVIDTGWALGLARAWRSRPGAGGFSGLVLPFRLDTAAQIAFEAGGGFGRGFKRREFAAAQFDNRLHPVGAGVIGAGCNMAFDRSLLRELGGFDDALDTGGPLPGGGDLDIFYRVLRSGRGMVYEPGYLVYHEHRETLPQLTRQYWSWGLGFMAFLVKSRRADPALHARQTAMVRWWFVDRLQALAGALRRGTWQDVRFVAAEIRGGIMGLAGEYDRSLRRIATIRAAAR